MKKPVEIAEVVENCIDEIQEFSDIKDQEEAALQLCMELIVKYDLDVYDQAMKRYING